MKLKDRAKAKAERRAARRNEPRTGSGPPIEPNDTGDVPPADADAVPPPPDRPR